MLQYLRNAILQNDSAGPPPPISIRPLRPQCDWCGEMAPVQNGRSVLLGPAFAPGFRLKCPATWAARSFSTLVNTYLPQTMQVSLSAPFHHDTCRASKPRPLLWRADFAQVLSLVCRTAPPIRTLSSAHSLTAFSIFELGRCQKLFGSCTRPHHHPGRRVPGHHHGLPHCTCRGIDFWCPGRLFFPVASQGRPTSRPRLCRGKGGAGQISMVSLGLVLLL